MSRVLGENKTHLSTNTYGTISYMAPELLTEGKLGKPADIYSFGILSTPNALIPHTTCRSAT